MRLLSVLCSLCCAVAAQTLLKDINPTPSQDGSSQFHASLAVGNVALVVADDGNSGVELYAADANGIRLVVDLYPGPKSSAPTLLATLSSYGYFTVASGTQTGLWRSDGTAAGTTFVHPVSATSATIWQGALWLLARPASNPGLPELWRSDGTAAGTQLAVQVLTGPSVPIRGELRALGGRLVFAVAGFDLWSTDGTPAGTQRLTGNIDALGLPLTALGSAIFFVTGDAAAGRELWKTDGTPTGTGMVADLNLGVAGSDPSGLVTLGNKLYFSAFDGTSRRLVVSDGTTIGTVAVGGQNVGTEVVAAGGALYFTASDANGAEPWISDGTPAGTRILADLAPGPSGSAPAGWLAAGGFVLFAADAGAGTGREPWVTDGTTAGTRLLLDIRTGQASSLAAPTFTLAFALGGLAFLTANNGIFGTELWRTDGTVAGTRMLGDLNRHLTASADILELVAGDGVAYFLATDAIGRAVWRTDGTPAGTRVAIRNLPGSAILLNHLRLVGERLYFRASIGGTNEALFASDGTEAGTVQLTPSPGISGTLKFVKPDLIQFAGRVWFAWGDATNGPELWSTDGTAAGTARFLDLEPGPTASNPHGFCVVGDTMLFGTWLFPPSTSKLWRTDGTVAGTRLVATLPAATMPVLSPLVLGNLVLFWGEGLYRSDGTAAGTYRIDSGVGSLDTGVVWRDAVYYVKGVGSVEAQLWRTDGTVAGTRLVRAFTPPQIATYIGALAATPTALLLAADPGGTGLELWTSDGTASGTVLLKDIAPGKDHGVAAPITSLARNPRAVFKGLDPLLGAELFVTDGTAQGTRLLADVHVGPGSSSPGGLQGSAQLTRLGSTLLFVADDGVNGAELFALDLRSLEPAFADPIGAPCGAAITSRGAPTLGSVTFAADLQKAPPSAPMLWLVGATRQQLPLLGCTVHVGGPLLALGGSTSAGGTATLPLVVPNDPRLLGGELYVQAAVADAPRLALSDAVRVTVGR